MPHRLTIRSAGPDDEPAIVALWQACGLVTSYNDPAEDFRFARRNSNSDVLVGIHGKGKLVGSVMVGHDGHRGWIYYVAAEPNYRRKCIGRRMTAAAEQWLKDRKIVKVMLPAARLQLYPIPQVNAQSAGRSGEGFRMSGRRKRWPRYEGRRTKTHRRTNSRESGQDSAVYGDFGAAVSLRGMVFQGSLRAESRL